MTFRPGGQGQGQTTPHLPLLDPLARDLCFGGGPATWGGGELGTEDWPLLLCQDEEIKSCNKGLHAGTGAGRWTGPDWRAGERPVCKVDGVSARAQPSWRAARAATIQVEQVTSVVNVTHFMDNPLSGK